jgi:hypothetical protein
MTVAGDLLGRVVGGLVTEGLRRGYLELKFAVRRRHTIDRAISGAPVEPDPRVKKSIDDLQLVIGTARGELTESVAAFIREIERSAIPESLVRCVLMNGDPSDIYPAFEVIYQAFSETISFDPKNFFSALFQAVKLRTEHQVKDPAMLEFV